MLSTGICTAQYDSGVLRLLLYSGQLEYCVLRKVIVVDINHSKKHHHHHHILLLSNQRTTPIMTSKSCSSSTVLLLALTISCTSSFAFQPNSNYLMLSARFLVTSLKRRDKNACRLSMAASFSGKTVTSLHPVPSGAHRFFLMRHGESEFNNANVFTGWCDVALTQRGVVEAVEAGQVFASHGLVFRKVYASVLTRSIVTAHRSLEAAGVSYTPITYDWRLNERHYGALQGLSKERTADRLGKARVMEWRRSYEARPPLMTKEHPHYDIIHKDARYKSLAVIPLGESLQDCQERVIEAWKDILAEVQMENCGDDDSSKSSLIVAHANTLRALAMHLDDIPGDEIEDLNIPTAIPFYYDICTSTGAVLAASHDHADTIGLGKFRGIYISDERKKRSFLERRRTANDPWLWALHDHQVARSMLIEPEDDDGLGEGYEGLEEEARSNTALFSSTLRDQDAVAEQSAVISTTLDRMVNGEV
jgi:2,3-bisphosphoglycerate-dependent phosphoglycerate mutase